MIGYDIMMLYFLPLVILSLSKITYMESRFKRMRIHQHDQSIAMLRSRHQGRTNL